MKGLVAAFSAGLAAAGAVALLPFLRNRFERPLERRRRARPDPVDLNSAEENELATLPGIDQEIAARIVENRPYRNKLDLLSRMILPEQLYVPIRRRILVTRAAAVQPVKIAT